jgi:hypothetical protein
MFWRGIGESSGQEQNGLGERPITNDSGADSLLTGQPSS